MRRPIRSPRLAPQRIKGLRREFDSARNAVVLGERGVVTYQFLGLLGDIAVIEFLRAVGVAQHDVEVRQAIIGRDVVSQLGRGRQDLVQPLDLLEQFGETTAGFRLEERPIEQAVQDDVVAARIYLD